MEYFSIIICTYNPNFLLFKRLLAAICKFKYEQCLFEVIIVDNNSTRALAATPEIADFLRKQDNANVILESNAGLTAARIAGIQKAKYNWLIFFDDDNEPDPNYLKEIAVISKSYPLVGAWGPGKVSVEYPDINYERSFNAVKCIFQERNELIEKIDDNFWWQDCYPAGTGLIIRKDVATEYAKNVLGRKYNLSDRKGKSLTSGGDLQMVLTAIKLGYSAGVHPALRINHIIDKSRLNRRYLRRLAYGTAISNVPGHLQIWGKDKLGSFSPPTAAQILRQLYFHLKVKFLKEGTLRTEISFCNHLGSWGGLYEANPDIKPLFIWKILCKTLQVT